MRTLLAVAAMLLMQDATHTLKYGAPSKPLSLPISAEWSLAFKVEGSEVLTNMVRSGMELLNFQKLHVRGDGHRGCHVTPKGTAFNKIELASSRVDGSFDDQPFEFDFDRASPPGDIEKKGLKQVAYFMGMAAREFTLDAVGTFSAKDTNQDAWGEALEMLVVGAVRLSDKPVKTGEEWTAEWKTRGRQKDNGGRFGFKQKAKIEKIEEKAGRKRAKISYEITGMLEVAEERKDKNAKKQETEFLARGVIVLDVEGGWVCASEGKGTVKALASYPDPNSSDTHDLTILVEVESKIVEKE